MVFARANDSFIECLFSNLLGEEAVWRRLTRLGTRGNYRDRRDPASCTKNPTPFTVLSRGDEGEYEERRPSEKIVGLVSPPAVWNFRIVEETR